MQVSSWYLKCETMNLIPRSVNEIHNFLDTKSINKGEEMVFISWTLELKWYEYKTNLLLLRFTTNQRVSSCMLFGQVAILERLFSYM